MDPGAALFAPTPGYRAIRKGALGRIQWPSSWSTNWSLKGSSLCNPRRTQPYHLSHFFYPHHRWPIHGDCASPTTARLKASVNQFKRAGKRGSGVIVFMNVHAPALADAQSFQDEQTSTCARRWRSAICRSIQRRPVTEIFYDATGSELFEADHAAWPEYYPTPATELKILRDRGRRDRPRSIPKGGGPRRVRRGGRDPPRSRLPAG